MSKCCCSGPCAFQRLTIPSGCPASFAELLRKCWATEAKVSYIYIQINVVLYVCFHVNHIQSKCFSVHVGKANVQADPVYSGVYV